MNLEICCGNIEDVKIANYFPIKRIELNQGLSIGGLTPSYSLFNESIKISNVDIICMIRLREGNFVYTDDEFNIMYNDAKFFLENGASGIVFGFLTNDNEIDITKTKKMISLAKEYNKEAIFHRAIDVTNSYFDSLDILKSLNIDRILTSGHEKNAILGIDNLKKALKNYPIIIGCGINDENLNYFINLGFNEIHGSFSKIIRNDYKIDFGSYSCCSYNKLSSIDFKSF